MRAWARLPEFGRLQNRDFFSSAELTYAPPWREKGNYGVAMRTLFRFGIPKGCQVHRIEAKSSDKDLATERYAELLSGRIDLLAEERRSIQVSYISDAGAAAVLKLTIGLM